MLLEYQNCTYLTRLYSSLSLPLILSLSLCSSFSCPNPFLSRFMKSWTTLEFCIEYIVVPEICRTIVKILSKSQKLLPASSETLHAVNEMYTACILRVRSISWCSWLQLIAPNWENKTCLPLLLRVQFQLNVSAGIQGMQQAAKCRQCGISVSPSSRTQSVTNINEFYLTARKIAFADYDV